MTERRPEMNRPTLVVPDAPQEDAPPPQVLRPPSVVLGGRYQLGQVLGSGAQATVYRARDLMLGVDRAVKVLGGDPSAQRSTLLRRLRQEAHVMARLAHPHLLHVVDVGHDQQLDYVVMQLCEGGSLQERLDRDGPMPVESAVRAMIGVLDALGTAHRAGIVHRDVKPLNLLLDADGRVMLSDFGIALLIGDDSRRTRAGSSMGSFAYMPPEQRLDARSVGPAADLYAAGSTLYALVTGDNPIDLFTAPRDSSRWLAVPEPLRATLYRATRHDPEARHPSAEAFSAELAQVLLLAPAGVAPQVDEPVRQRRAWGALATLAAVALALTAAVWWTSGELPAPE
ncbi:MAG: serine/threonine-protein kinase, partial [Myxococcota bacterium]